MAGDPKNQQDRIERAAAIANGNQRLTRAVNLLALHLEAGVPLASAELKAFAGRADTGLGALAAALEAPATGPAGLTAAQAALDQLRFPQPAAGVPRLVWVFGQLARAGTELSAMLLAGREGSAPV
jgi:hypothetical protein